MSGLAGGIDSHKHMSPSSAEVTGCSAAMTSVQDRNDVEVSTLPAPH